MKTFMIYVLIGFGVLLIDQVIDSIREEYNLLEIAKLALAELKSVIKNDLHGTDRTVFVILTIVSTILAFVLWPITEIVIILKRMKRHDDYINELKEILDDRYES